MSWKDYKKQMEEVWKKQEEAEKRETKNTSSNKITKTTSNKSNNSFTIQQTVSPSITKENTFQRVVQPSAIEKITNNDTKYGRGNIDLTNRKVVNNKDGSISTERSISINENGKEILIPTVINGKIVSDEEAIDYYHKTGKYLGKFDSIKEADDYAQKLHERQEQMYSNSSLWNQIQSISNQENSASRVRMLSGSEAKRAEELAKEQGTYDLSTHDIDAKIEADNFNKIMEKGTTKEKVDAILGHFGNSILGGAKQTIGGVANIGTTVGAGIVKGAKLIANDKSKEELDKWYNDIVETGREINDRATYFNKVNSRINNDAVRTVTGATNTVANVATNALFTAGTGGGTVLQGMQVGGSSAQEVLNENKDNIGQAIGTGTLKGITSYLTEKMFDANILTKGANKSSIQKLVNNAIEKKIGSQVGRTVADKAVGIVGENIEEIVEDNVGNLIDKVINNKDFPEMKNWLNNTSETIKATTLSTAILNLVGLGGNNNQDIETELRNQNASEEDIQNAKQFVQIASQENTDNKVIEQETKTLQNQTSQEQVDNTVANNKEQVRIDSENFARQVDQYVSGKMKSSDLLNVGKTPQVLKNIGVPDNDIILKQSKLRTIMEESNDPTSKLHGLSADTVKRIPEALANPLNVLQSSTDPNSIVVITDLADKAERPIIASIEMNYEGQIGNLDFLSNRLTSAYGKNNYDRFMQTEIAKGNLLYDIDEGIIKELPTSTRVQSPEGLNSSVDTVDSVSTSNNSIPQNETNVKGTTVNNSIMPENQNNTLIVQKNQKKKIQLPLKQTNQNTENIQTQNNNTKGEKINWNEIERPEENKKFRKHYRSIIESSNTTAEAKSIAKELMGTDTYVPETNKGQLAQADQRIMTSSPETELQSLLSKAMNGEKISSVDVAVGERLIQYFSKTGNKQQLQEAIQATAMAGTSAGQTVQALAMLNHQTPQGQVTWLQRSVDKMNKELAKKKGGTITTDADGNIQVINKQGKDITNKVDLFNLTPEMIDKIMNSETQEQMYKNIDEVYEELGQQVPKSMIEKIDSWRYFSMLANARTHIRNMVGNVAMGKMQRAKDKLAGGIEDVVSKFNPEMERTKTLRLADKKTKEFAKQDFKNADVQSRLELNENKYNPQSRLQNARRTFKSDAMENTLGRLFNLNDSLLEAEDGLGLKAGYQKALTDYLTANKIDVDNITDAQLNKARNYAIQQAKEATFHQANAIASAVTQFQNKNKATKLFIDAVLPFKKTPMNIAKAGMEYSPLQIAKSATIDVVNLRKGKISINQYIDNLSKGMTGTGIALVGYALANAGILKASGGDDKDKEKYEEEQGKQSYSIEIGGKTYSLDWLAPTGIPLFIGAETYKLFNQESTEKNTDKTSEEDGLRQVIKNVTNMFDAGATAIDPMNQMSMISGLTNMLSSYNSQDKLGSLGAMMTNAGKSYINQFFPTLMGQVAKTSDEYERSTKSTATGTIGKAVDQTINQIKAKVPGLRQTLPIKTDIWGKDVKQEASLPLRALNNFVNPATVKNVSTDAVDKELNSLYEVNNNSSILPDILTKTLQLNSQKYRLSNKEYAKYTKKYGQISYELIGNLIKTSDYKNLTQEQKEEAISNIYSYAKEKNKLEYAKKVNEEVKPSILYNTMEDLKKNGGKQSEYLSYLSKVKGLEKESDKNKVLANSNYSDKTKEIIYANGTGKDDDSYKEIRSDVNITNYLKYKTLVADKTKELKEKGELKDEQQLSNRKQIELLKNMDCSNNEKAEIYSTCINKKDKVYSGLSKLTDLNVDAYLDYKMQEIKGDEDTDSNIKGKTESGSKKKNVIQYLNNANFTRIERLYIYGSSYKFNSKEQSIMKEYLNNSNLSSKEKLEVVKGLTANVEQHKDGKYYWKKPAKK